MNNGMELSALSVLGLSDSIPPLAQTWHFDIDIVSHLQKYSRVQNILIGQAGGG